MVRRSGKRSNRVSHSGSRSAASRRGPKTNSANIYASLGEMAGSEAEMDSHSLPESSLLDENIPISGTSRNSNEIYEYFERAKRPVIGGAWLQQPEIPNSSEVLRDKSGFTNSESLIELNDHVRPHKVEGAYDDMEDYLRTLYELLREDTIRPLREAIDEVRTDPFKDEAEYQNQSIGIYESVYIKSLVLSPRGLATRVAFSLGRAKKHVRWGQSKRLITGSLVALSPTDDAFKTQCVLAIVAARPISALEQNPPTIDLFFARPEDQEIDPMRKWIMVESRASFFEANRHTLLALQQLMREPFMLSKYLVYAQKEVDPPAYIQHNPYTNLSSLVSMEDAEDYENVNVLQNWPAASSHFLDESQSRALKRMLTSELAIVQGPPGTGKTFVSVVALQIARDNLRKKDAPIIVTAQTNHALDQLLRHTSVFEPNYIRLGGRSKDNDIKKQTLFEVKSRTPQQKGSGSSIKKKASGKIKSLTTECQKLLAPIEANKGPLDHSLLLKFELITQKQAESLEMDSQDAIGISSSNHPGILIEQWLGRCLVPCDRPTLPEDLDWDYEEEDFEVEQLQELEAEAVAQDDDDIEALRGPVIEISDNFKGTGTSLSNADIRDILRKKNDLYTIRTADRGAIYNFFKREVKRMIATEIRKIAKTYHDNVVQHKIGVFEENARILRGARIIGCTTTGLAKYRALLSSLHPRLCIVEEAAETLEAPVTAACFPSLEHLILVGDHQQLRPHTQVRAFEDEPYFLNLSLFERLVRNNIVFDTLTRQRRMIPEIRRLLCPIYEDKLKDHPNVENTDHRPPVEGMGGNNSFFFCHEWPEDRDIYMSSYNAREAAMVVQFLDYLVLNGVDATKITVLTFYNGQRRQIAQLIRMNPNLGVYRGIQVVTVDSYQGEENDIVLLSLVRSNKKNNIGFLSSENRACVALSRAKRGFYIFGNAELLASQSSIWGSVVEIMFKNKKPKVKAGQERRVGYHLPLVCSNHGRKVWCEDPGDFELIKGGCDAKCDGVLPCGHRCPYTCHPFEHDRINCTQKCARRVERCGHPCVAECCDPCRCHMCERRSDGIKPVLKVGPRGAASSSGPRSNIQNLSLETKLDVPRSSNYGMAFSTTRSGTTQLPQGTTEQWDAYAHGGGVEEDDMRFRAKMRQEEAEYLERIQASIPKPMRPCVGNRLISTPPVKAEWLEMDTDLLIDLDAEPQIQPGQSQPRSDYASIAAQHTSQTPYTNLLD
ncbi:hypothetical protein COCVIDRAFT_19177 [Bipolaris victoriae FI3]|uniref:Helicase ATP-binding domain-containing protein n=1 Tax=Bipolaris victoriae (strain FI3) TaxID=930091 RepID=W7EGF7_BIPV3|nr:hypothetical protein COCVIDRAFT_19177 [Bipolaris victoriae FI3]